MSLRGERELKHTLSVDDTRTMQLQSRLFAVTWRQHQTSGIGALCGQHHSFVSAPVGSAERSNVAQLETFIEDMYKIL